MFSIPAYSYYTRKQNEYKLHKENKDYSSAFLLSLFTRKHISTTVAWLRNKDTTSKKNLFIYSFP